MVKNLQELMIKFQDEQTCRDYLVQQRWNGVPTCPYCGSTKSYRVENGKRFKCGNSTCYTKYSVTVGTIFEGSNLPLSKWFAAMYILSTHKKGISSVQLAKDLGITQKSAWFVLHRIREALKESNPGMLTGVVEVDEAYMAKKYMSDYQGLSEEQVAKIPVKSRDKGAVVGMIQRGGEVILRSFDSRTAANVCDTVKAHVDKQARVITDEAYIYRKGLAEYNRDTILHRFH